MPESNARVRSYRGLEITVDQHGSFLIDDEPHGFVTLQQAMEYIDHTALANAKNANTNVAIKSLRDDGAHGIVTGINRTNRKPTAPKCRTPAPPASKTGPSTSITPGSKRPSIKDTSPSNGSTNSGPNWPPPPSGSRDPGGWSLRNTPSS